MIVYEVILPFQGAISLKAFARKSSESSRKIHEINLGSENEIKNWMETGMK